MGVHHRQEHTKGKWGNAKFCRFGPVWNRTSADEQIFLQGPAPTIGEIPKVVYVEYSLKMLAGRDNKRLYS